MCRVRPFFFLRRYTQVLLTCRSNSVHMKGSVASSGLSNAHITETAALKLYKQFIDPNNTMSEDMVKNMWKKLDEIEKSGFMFVFSLHFSVVSSEWSFQSTIRKSCLVAATLPTTRGTTNTACSSGRGCTRTTKRGPRSTARASRKTCRSIQ